MSSSEMQEHAISNTWNGQMSSLETMNFRLRKSVEGDTTSVFLCEQRSLELTLLLTLLKHDMYIYICMRIIYENTTPPKFNMAPGKWWLEDYFPIGKVTFQGLC